MLAYLSRMTIRLIEMRRVLKPNGSIYLHCDPTASHYLKIMMDGVFHPVGGEMRSEIIWRIGWVSGFKTQRRGWIRNYDTILYYALGNRFTFNKEYLRTRKGIHGETAACREAQVSPSRTPGTATRETSSIPS